MTDKLILIKERAKRFDNYIAIWYYRLQTKGGRTELISVEVDLEKPKIILAPITDEEKDEFERKPFGDERIYVLYRLPDSDEIHIGMLSTSMRKYFPSLANVWELDKATAMAFFYNGCSDLETAALKQEVNDRPVYSVSPSEGRTVVGYDVLNGTPENGLSVPLEDVVDGKYTLSAENTNTSDVSRSL